MSVILYFNAIIIFLKNECCMSSLYHQLFHWNLFTNIIWFVSPNNIMNPSIDFLDAHIDCWIIKAGTSFASGHYPNLSCPNLPLSLDVPPQRSPRVALTRVYTTNEPVIRITLLGPQWLSGVIGFHEVLESGRLKSIRQSQQLSRG